MTRTTRDVYLKGVNLEEVKTTVLKWAQRNKVKILINTPNYVYGRWGRGILSAVKYFEVTLEQAEDGILAKTEGWIMFILPNGCITLELSCQKLNSANQAWRMRVFQEKKAWKPSKDYGLLLKRYQKLEPEETL